MDDRKKQAGKEAESGERQGWWLKNLLAAGLYVLLGLIPPFGGERIPFRLCDGLAVLPFHKRQYIPAILLGILLSGLIQQAGWIGPLLSLLAALISYACSSFIDDHLANVVLYAFLRGVMVSLQLMLEKGVPFRLSLISNALTTLLICLVANFILSWWEKRKKQ